MHKPFIDAVLESAIVSKLDEIIGGYQFVVDRQFVSNKLPGAKTLRTYDLPNVVPFDPFTCSVAAWKSGDDILLGITISNLCCNNYDKMYMQSISDNTSRCIYKDSIHNLDFDKIDEVFSQCDPLGSLAVDLSNKYAGDTIKLRSVLSISLKNMPIKRAGRAALGKLVDVYPYIPNLTSILASNSFLFCHKHADAFIHFYYNEDISSCSQCRDALQKYQDYLNSHFDIMTVANTDKLRSVLQHLLR